MFIAAGIGWPTISIMRGLSKFSDVYRAAATQHQDVRSAQQKEVIASVEHGISSIVGGLIVGLFGVGLALDARELGAVVIALTSVDFERDPRVASEHPSGQSLHQAADVVVDLQSPYGDGEFELAGVAILPSTGATGVVALWMIFAEAVSLLVARGKLPLVWQSNLLPGAIARNAAVSAGYERTRRGYEPRGDAS